MDLHVSVDPPIWISSAGPHLDPTSGVLARNLAMIVSSN